MRRKTLRKREREASGLAHSLGDTLLNRYRPPAVCEAYPSASSASRR